MAISRRKSARGTFQELRVAVVEPHMLAVSLIVIGTFRKVKKISKFYLSVIYATQFYLKCLMRSIIFSGSMEMEGASPGSSSFLPSYNPSRNVSVETNEQPRASSSLSSEEGGEPSSGHNHRSLHIRWAQCWNLKLAISHWWIAK